MKRTLGAALIGWGLLASAGAMAGVSAPQVSATLTREGPDLRLDLSVENREAFPLESVFPVLRLGQELVELPAEEQLPTGVVAAWSHDFPATQLEAPGGAMLPVLIRVHYHDAMSYPASVPLALLAGPESTRSQPPLRSALELRDASDRPSLVLELESRSDQALEGSLEIFLSSELAAEPARASFRLEPMQELERVFRVRSSGALGGSHEVYAVVRVTEPPTAAGVTLLSADLRLTPEMVEEPALRRRVAGVAGVVSLVFLLTALFEVRAVQDALSGRASEG